MVFSDHRLRNEVHMREPVRDDAAYAGKLCTKRTCILSNQCRAVTLLF